MLDHIIFERVADAVRNFPKPLITCVDGVPGCGKSTWIINTHKMGKDLVLCATKEGILDIREKVSRLCDSAEAFDKIVNNYRTIASYLINSKVSYETVYIDEYTMVHAGFIGLISLLSRCSKIFILGDHRQIPFIDRLHYTDMRFYEPRKFVSDTLKLTHSYRCPIDVVFALKDVYDVFTTSNTISRSVNAIITPRVLEEVPSMENTLYLTFTQADKTSLLGVLHLPSTSLVKTIHEAQGLTFPSVICVRTCDRKVALFDSMPHIIVALTRHTGSFLYLTPIVDVLHQYVSKAERVSQEFLDSMLIHSIEKLDAQQHVAEHTPGYLHDRTKVHMQNDEPNCETVSEPNARPKQHLDIFYHNSGGMRSKSSNFYLSLIETEYDIVAITETWFVKSVASQEFFPSSYNVFRKDRYGQSDTKMRGGGVLLAVKNNLRCELVECKGEEFEIVTVKITQQDRYLYVCVLYTLPGATFHFFSQFMQFFKENILSRLGPLDDIVLVGDFNFPRITWTVFDDVLTPFNNNETTSLVFDNFFASGMLQYNQVENRNGKLLDLVFASAGLVSTITPCEDLGGAESVHHTPLHLILSVNNCDIVVNTANTLYDFRRGDYASLDSFLENETWDFLSRETDMDEMIERFYNVLRTGIEKYIPTKRSSYAYREPWFNKQLMNLRNRKSKAHKTYKRSGSTEDYRVFDQLRREFRTLNRFLHGNYILEIETQLTSNPKQFWSYVNSKRKHHGYPSPMRHEGNVATSVGEICELFARFFRTVYRESPVLPYSVQHPKTFSRFINISFTEDQILEGIQSLDNEKSAGPDKIPPRVLKACHGSLVYPLTFLFNESLQRGHFPDFWKLSYITPIFKSGSRNTICNYRGIAILSTIPKLFERLVRDSLFFHLKNFISPRQHGFYPGRSTTTNLVMMTNYLTESVESGAQVDVIYTDFSKAFDRIDHDLLIKKLANLDSEFIPTKWIYSYLSNRKQLVRIGELNSNVIHVTSGVPQGSHLGPLLFTLFIDDVLSCFSFCQCLMYADDLKIFASIKSDIDVLNLKSDLNTFGRWTLTNRLELNIKKCKVMTFSRSRLNRTELYELNGFSLERTLSVADLGVLFSQDLNFSKHIECIVSKANSMLGFLIRNTKDFQDPYTLRALYISFVRSQLEYATVVWSPYQALYCNRIESVQRKFLLYALRRFPRNRDSYSLPPYEGRCALLALQPLQSRRNVAGALFCRDMLMGRMDCADLLGRFDLNVPERTLRPRCLLGQRFHRTDYGKNEPVASMARLLNGVGEDFDFNLSRNEFKNRIL